MCEIVWSGIHPHKFWSMTEKQLFIRSYFLQDLVHLLMITKGGASQVCNCKTHLQHLQHFWICHETCSMSIQFSFTSCCHMALTITEIRFLRKIREILSIVPLSFSLPFFQQCDEIMIYVGIQGAIILPTQIIPTSFQVNSLKTYSNTFAFVWTPPQYELFMVAAE